MQNLNHIWHRTGNVTTLLHTLLIMGKSSKDKRDAYYRLAKEQGWRARSAFKLLQLDEEFDLFEGVTRVVDLCAAPGSWSQVLSRVLIKGERVGRAAWEDKRHKELLRLRQAESGEPQTSDESATPANQPRKDVKIVSIDLQPMSPLEGITCLKADITHPSTIPLLLNALDADFIPGSTSIEAAQPVDLVISDGAPDVTGLHDLDIYIQSQLLWAALNLALCVLKPGGKFVAKIFRGKDVDLLYAQMKVLFEHVTVAKPRSSRASSVEAFIVCINFQPPQGFKASLENPLGAGRIIKPSSGARKQNAGVSRKLREDGVTELDLGSDTENENEGNRWIAPFLACGDLSAFDADASHKLPAGHVSLDPVQPPTAPPYKRALEERKKMGGAYGKTKPELVK
jgi:tRNA (cytidine32/guanosine34-2'-O)-methyltransferase